MSNDATQRELIHAGLEALRGAMPLGLCAYLHEPSGQAPELAMAAPRMEEIEPAEAFTLFTALRDALATDVRPGEELSLSGFVAVAHPTIGTRSRGMHVAGRRGAPLDRTERDTFRRLAAGLGAAVHILEEGEARRRASPTEPIRVAVDLVDGRANAEVAVPLGEEIRTGTAEASLSSRAVVAAVIDATDRSLKIIDATTGAIGEDRASLVLLEDGFGHRALGADLIDAATDQLHSIASAALEAAVKLTRHGP